ncbi:MAG: biopolymer transporter ExbD [Planctomycetota bacterium]
MPSPTAFGQRLRRRGGAQAASGTSMAPLIDVLFLLLIFLLLSANFDRQRVMEVALPEAAQSSEAPRTGDAPQRVVTLRVDDVLLWNGIALTLDELTTALSQRPPEERLLPIFVRSDASVPLGRGVELLDRLRGIGYLNCLLEVAPPR